MIILLAVTVLVNHAVWMLLCIQLPDEKRSLVWFSYALENCKTLNDMLLVHIFFKLLLLLLLFLFTIRLITLTLANVLGIMK